MCTLSGSSRGSAGPPRAGLQLWLKLKLLDDNLKSYERGMLCSLFAALELNGSRTRSVGGRGLPRSVTAGAGAGGYSRGCELSGTAHRPVWSARQPPLQVYGVE